MEAFVCVERRACTVLDFPDAVEPAVMTLFYYSVLSVCVSVHKSTDS